jgi:hypothetical protein
MKSLGNDAVLLASAGFQLNTTIPVSPDITIVEALPSPMTGKHM